MIYLSSINERIAYLIDASGLTKTAFANRVNLSQPFISGICSGTKSPSDRTISDICREFGVSQTWLQTGEGEMFLPRSKNEELALMVADLMAETDDSFRKRFVSAFLAFPPDKMAVLEEFIDLLADAKSTEDT